MKITNTTPGSGLSLACAVRSSVTPLSSSCSSSRRTRQRQATGHRVGIFNTCRRNKAVLEMITTRSEVERKHVKQDESVKWELTAADVHLRLTGEEAALSSSVFTAVQRRPHRKRQSRRTVGFWMFEIRTNSQTNWLQNSGRTDHSEKPDKGAYSWAQTSASLYTGNVLYSSGWFILVDPLSSNTLSDNLRYLAIWELFYRRKHFLIFSYAVYLHSAVNDSELQRHTGIKVSCLKWFQKERVRKKKKQSRNSKVSPVFSSLRYKSAAWGGLTHTVLLVPVQSVSSSAVTLKPSCHVLTHVSTAAVIHAALVNVWHQTAKRKHFIPLQNKSFLQQVQQIPVTWLILLK